MRKIRKFISRINTFLKRFKFLLLTLFVGILLLDCVLASPRNDLIYIALLLMYFYMIGLFSLRSKVTLSICLVLLIIMAFQFLTSGVTLGSDRTAVWFYFFLATAIFQQWRE